MQKRKQPRFARVSEDSAEYDQTLMPWADIANEWHRRSGERISGTRAWQIANGALRKIKEAFTPTPAPRGTERR